MKFGLFIGLLVLLASTNVFGRDKTTVTITDSGESKDTGRVVTKPGKVEVNTEGQDRVKTNKGVKVEITGDSDGSNVEKQSTESKTGRLPAERVTLEKENTRPADAELRPESEERRNPVKTNNKVKIEITGESDGSNVEKQSTEVKTDRLPAEHVTLEKEKTRPAATELRPESEERRDPVKTNKKVKIEITGESEGSNVGKQSTEIKTDRLPAERVTVENEKTKPAVAELRPDSEERRGEAHLVINGDESKKPVEAMPFIGGIVLPENHVHVSGNIVLRKYSQSSIDTVQYDFDGARLLNGGSVLKEFRPFSYDFLGSQSRVTLYVATSKTTDPKLAFAKISVKHGSNDHFPLPFETDIELPSQQRGLLDRADITLYFFVYITNLETRVDTYLPAGTSQILLQGTRTLVQKLDVYVKASGIEITGLFRGRFGQQIISSGTAFQIYIVPEYSLALRHTDKFESVAQLTINSVPSMFPVPFSLMVDYKSLKPSTRYYAFAYILENGIQRPIHQEPIWVINEQNILVTSQIVFNVIPSPFILRGVVSRSMPGPFYLQPRSSLILRLHEFGSDSQDIIYKLPEILTFPQVFQINISQSSRFDASKKYDIRALITDEKNNIYMASLQPIPLLDELSRLIVPVDDLLYNVQVRLQASSNQYLSYVAGSTAQIFVTDSPEVPVKPIVVISINSIASDFRDFSIQVPATAILRNRNYYLVMMIEINGMITHVSKTLLISNNQPPPFVIQLPVLSLNLVTGVIYDKDNRRAQWTSSSYANVYLVDDHPEKLGDNVVQVWKVHVENDFPIRFEVQLDFGRLRQNHVYRLQAAIENGPGLIEYKPAGSVLTLTSNGGIITDLRVPVVNVKTFQRVKGLIYINDFHGPLPEKGEIIVQLSSTSSLTQPRIVEELRIKVEGRNLPIEFTMDLPLTKVDLSSVYYFFVQYLVRDNVIIPASQAFTFSPRNDVTVVLTISKTPQIPITGQITSTGRPLMLPDGAVFHIYITDNATLSKPVIFNEVFLRASPNSLYEFRMTIDSLLLQKRVGLYLRADILYRDSIILSIPRPALLQITPGGEWNINLVVDLPTLLVGQIMSMSQFEATGGEFEVYIQILKRGTTHILTTSRLRLEATFPQSFRVEIENEILVQYPFLQARAIIKNCKEQILFEAGGFVDIHTGINVKVDLPVVLVNPQRMKELHVNVNQVASLYAGLWQVSITGTETGTTNNLLLGRDGDTITTLDTEFVRQQK